MTVYLDVAFGINFIMDYFVLMSAVSMSGMRASRWRLMLGALAGGVYGAAVWLPGFEFLSALPLKIGVGVLMSLCCFAPDRKFLKHTMLVFFSAFAYSGCTAAVGQVMGGQSVKVLAVSTLISMAVMTAVFSCFARHRGVGGETVVCTVYNKGSAAKLTALRDSGNTLKDPLTGAPVMVAELDSLRAVLPVGAFEKMRGNDPVSICRSVEGVRLISCRTVGSENVLLPVIKPERVEVGGKTVKGGLVAVTQVAVSAQGGYTALVSVD